MFRFDSRWMVMDPFACLLPLGLGFVPWRNLAITAGDSSDAADEWFAFAADHRSFENPPRTLAPTSSLFFPQGTP
uniref:Putative secreted protein n=1 Tax=Anopheles marajoara TaxID=58244 RepID=A0A2M4CE24_9DIPT